MTDAKRERKIGRQKIKKERMKTKNKYSEILVKPS